MKRKLFWFVNFMVLSLFSMYTIAGLTGGPHKAYADALSDKNFSHKSKHFMVVDKDEGGSASGDVKEICTLNDQQVAELDAFFKVDTFNLTVNGNEVTIAEVSGRHLTKKQLMDYLRASDQTLECKLVERHHIFFLPVLPQIS